MTEPRQSVQLSKPYIYRYTCDECGGQRDQKLSCSSSTQIRCICGAMAHKLTGEDMEAVELDWWFKDGNRKKPVLRELSRKYRKGGRLAGDLDFHWRHMFDISRLWERGH
mgnify:FL=1